jgi:hypothetical protein
MSQLNYINFIDFRNLQIEMCIVHRRQVVVVGIVRRPIDTVILQILELIPKVPGSSSRGVYLNKCRITHLTPYGGRN